MEVGRGKNAARGRPTAAVLRQNAIPFLLHLQKLNEWAAPTKVARAIGGDPKYAVELAERLAAARLVDLKPGPKVAGEPTFRVMITPRGRELLALLEPVIAFFEGRPESEPRPRNTASRGPTG